MSWHYLPELLLSENLPSSRARGGGILGGLLLGWRTVCAVEIESYCREVLLRRQRDGVLPLFPIWDDILTFDGRPWRGKVDIITAGFPCQDISCAGRGAGINGPKSGLWREAARIIGEVRPEFVLVENSPVITRRGLGVVLGDLAEAGYDAEWGVFSAAEIGAPHLRKRIWILAHSNNPATARQRELGGEIPAFAKSERFDMGGAAVADSQGRRTGRLPARSWTEREREADLGRESSLVSDALDKGFQDWGQARISKSSKRLSYSTTERRRISWWDIEPGLGRVADGVAHRIHRLKAIGNGQVPAVAARAWTELSRRAGIA